MKLMKGSKFTKEWFEEGSRPTKQQLVEWIANEDIPGRLIGGEPYVDTRRFISQPQAGPYVGPKKTTVMDLLS